VPAKLCQHPSHDLDLGSASSDGVQVLKVDRDKPCKFKGFNQVGALVRPPDLHKREVCIPYFLDH
jgi:hypothetical protein